MHSEPSGFYPFGHQTIYSRVHTAVRPGGGRGRAALFIIRRSAILEGFSADFTAEAAHFCVRHQPNVLECP
jgi:hypothetical protein